MSALVSHVLLVASLCALGAAALRLSSLLAPAGLERLVASAVLLGAAVVLEALALGLAGLSGSTAALSAAAVLTWLAAVRWLPRPAVSVTGELSAWWAELAPAARVGIGAAAGIWLAVSLTLLHRPEPGYDGITYHLPEVVGFVQSGHAGSLLATNYALPVGNYPLTNEVLLSWLTGISHGFSALTLWTPVSVALLLAAAWLGLRRLWVPRALALVALAALVLGPLLVVAVPEPGTDLPALTWLVCCAALCLAATDHPGLLGPALVAFGLAVGTKTTTASLGVVLLAAALWSARRRLSELGWQLALGAGAAVLVGGVWYVRNLILHGSPLWPFVATPWGDPIPLEIKLVSHTMLERFRVTLLDHLGAYMSGISGSLVLIIGGVLAGLAAARRRPLLAAAVVALGALAWANAPVTGLPDVPALITGARSSIRYLLPVFAAGAAALAIAATDGPRAVRAGAVLALLGALGWSLIDDLEHGFYLPFDSWLPAGAALGALVGAASVGRRRPERPRATPAVGRARSPGGPRRLLAVPAAGRRVTIGGLFGALAVAAVLAAQSGGFVARHGQVGSELDAAVAAYLASRPSYVAGDAPVAIAPFSLGLLGGDRLRHHVTLIAERAPCADVLARARRGWLVIIGIPAVPIPGYPGQVLVPAGMAAGCMAGRTPRFTSGSYRIFGPAS